MNRHPKPFFGPTLLQLAGLFAAAIAIVVVFNEFAIPPLVKWLNQ